MNKSVGLWVILMFTSFNTMSDSSEKKQETNRTSDISLELLEFLADFKTNNGEWVDPMLVRSMMKNAKTEDNSTEREND